jgi:hypothetical protein
MPKTPNLNANASRDARGGVRPPGVTNGVLNEFADPRSRSGSCFDRSGIFSDRSPSDEALRISELRVAIEHAVRGLRTTDAILEALLRFRQIRMGGVPRSFSKRVLELRGRTAKEYIELRHLKPHERAALASLSRKWSGTFRIGITGGLGETPIGIINRICHLETVPLWRRSRAKQGADDFSLLGIPKFGDDDFWVDLLRDVHAAEFQQLEKDLSGIFPGKDTRAYRVFHKTFESCGGLLFEDGLVRTAFSSWQRYEGEANGDVENTPDIAVLPFGNENMLYAE